jgi:hypothetical protein
MRKKLQFTLMVLAFMTGTAFAQVAYFPFDEDAIDDNQEINTTPEETGLTFVQDNYRGSVMAFDGSNGFVTFPGNDVYGYDALTYNLWFRWTTATANQWWVRIFDFGLPSDMEDHPGNHDVVFLTLFQDGLLRWHIHSVDWTDGMDTILVSQEPIALNEWYMLTCTHDADSAKLYLNGELQDARGVSGVKPSDLEFLTMFLGKSNWPDPLFTGKLDEFKIWNEVLTADEIAGLYTFPEVPSSVSSLDNEGINIYSYGRNLVVNIDNALPDASLKVYNIQGMEVYNESGFGSSIELGSLETGIYIVKVNNGNNAATAKVYIE